MGDLSIVDSQPLPSDAQPLSIVSSQPLAPKSIADQVSDAAGEFKNTLGGTVSGIGSLLTSEGRHQMATGWQEKNQELDQKVEDAIKSGNYTDAAVHALNRVVNTAIPGMGASLEQTAEDFKNGDIGKGLGRIAAVGLLAHAPDLAPTVLKGATAAATKLPSIPQVSPTAIDVAGLASPRLAHAMRLANKASSVLDNLKTSASPAPPAESATPSPSEPPMGTPLDQLTNYFKGKIAPESGPAGNSPEPVEIPEGKQSIAMPDSGSAVRPSSTFTAKQYEDAARIDKSSKLAKSLNAAGVNPDTLAEVLAKASPDQKAQLWSQAAKEASDLHGEPVNAPNSPATEAKTLFYLRRYANGLSDTGASEPVSFKSTQDPATAAKLTQGARRTMPDGSIQVLKSVPIEKISGDAGNQIYEPKVQEYQEKGYAAHPELRASEGGDYVIQEGHHRILADVRNGKGSVLAWTPEPNLGGASVIKPSPELMKALQKKGASKAAADLADALAK
jgi:hypothetical protein